MKVSFTDFAQEMNVAKNTIVYHVKRLSPELKEKYIIQKKNTQYLTEQGQNYLKQIIKPNLNNNPQEIKQDQEDNEQQTDFYAKIIQDETRKPDIKDVGGINAQSVIDSLNISLTNTQKLLAQEQQLHAETQKQLADKQLLLTQAEKDKDAEIKQTQEQAKKDKHSAVLKAVIITAVITGLIVAIVYNVIYYLY